MKQRLDQKQKLSLNLTFNLQKQIELLSYSDFEIRCKIDDLISEFCKDSDHKKLVFFRDEVLADKYRNAINPKLNNDFSEFQIVHEKNLKEKLLEQLYVSPLKGYETLIGEILIDSIQDNGRLDPELEYKDIKKIVKEDYLLDINDAKINSILKMIQNLDPPGCAYRSIEESLNIQIDNLNLISSEQNTIKQALRSLINQEIRIEDLNPGIRKQIHKLNLDQGTNFGSNKDFYLKPDLIAFSQKNLWHVSLNDEFMIQEIIEIIKNELNTPNSKRVIEAKSFLKGLEKRQQTLFLVSEFIVTTQSNYLNKESNRKPISNKVIAEALKLSESTISRIVRNKHLQLPDKIIPLKRLLQKKVNKNNEGKDITPKELQKLIKLLVSDENAKQPLSDESLRITLLKKHQIQIARRTITKYRKQAGIHSTRLRKIN